MPFSRDEIEMIAELARLDPPAPADAMAVAELDRIVAWAADLDPVTASPPPAPAGARQLARSGRGDEPRATAGEALLAPLQRRRGLVVAAPVGGGG